MAGVIQDFKNIPYLYEIFKNISYSFPIIKRKDSTDYGNDFENNKPLQIFQRANSRKQHIAEH